MLIKKKKILRALVAILVLLICSVLLFVPARAQTDTTFFSGDDELHHPFVTHEHFRAAELGGRGQLADLEAVRAPSDVVERFGMPESVDTGGDVNGERMLLTFHYEGLRLQYEGVRADVLWLRDAEVTTDEWPLRVGGVSISVGGSVDVLSESVSRAVRDEQVRIYVAPPGQEGPTDGSEAHGTFDIHLDGDVINRIRFRRSD